MPSKARLDKTPTQPELDSPQKQKQAEYPIQCPPKHTEDYEGYAATKINILNHESMHLKNHPINVAIRNYNVFINMTFKNKENIFNIP